MKPSSQAVSGGAAWTFMSSSYIRVVFLDSGEFPSPPELSKRHVSTPDAPKRPTRRRIHGGDGSLQPLQLSFWGQDTRQYLTAHYREVVLRLACMYSDGATFELCPAYRARKLVAAVHAPVDFDACRTTCPNFFKCIERISERRPTNGIV